MRISLFLVADVCTVVAARRSSSIRGYKRALLVHIHFVNTRTDVKRNENMDRRPNGQQKYCEITIDWTCVYTRWRASVDATQQRIEVGWKMQRLRKEGYDTVVTSIKKRCCLLQVGEKRHNTDGSSELWLVYTTSSMSNRAIPSPVQPYYLLCRRVTGLKCFFVLHPAGVEQTACIIKSSSNRLHDIYIYIYIYICICIELDFKSVHTLESEPSAEETVGEVFRVTVL